MRFTPAILLAAGQSRRMGTQKLLLPFAGQTLIGHIADQLLAAGLDPVIAIVSEPHNPVAQILSTKRVDIAVNPNPHGDMLSSIRTGLRTLADQKSKIKNRKSHTPILLALGDQPAIQPQLIEQMIRAFETTGKTIIVPVHAGRRGHPLLFCARYIDEILTHYDDAGLRALLDAHPADIHELSTPDPSILADIDHPQDYAREVARHPPSTTGN